MCTSICAAGAAKVAAGLMCFSVEAKSAFAFALITWMVKGTKRQDAMSLKSFELGGNVVTGQRGGGESLPGEKNVLPAQRPGHRTLKP